jgi:hypothetical protein
MQPQFNQSVVIKLLVRQVSQFSTSNHFGRHIDQRVFIHSAYLSILGLKTRKLGAEEVGLKTLG